MTTTAQIGLGAEFWLGNATNVLTKLGEILTVTPPNSQTAEIEATHMGSPNRRREWIAGLIEDGDGTFEMNYTPNSATDILIRAAQTAGLPTTYKIVIPNGAAKWEVSGTCIVRGYQRAIPIDNRMLATLTVRFTGASAEAAGV